MSGRKQVEPGTPYNVKFHDEQLSDHLISTRWGPLLWWRITRAAAIDGVPRGTAIKQLVARGLGPMSEDEQLEYRRHVKSATEHLRRSLAGSGTAQLRPAEAALVREPRPMAPPRPSACEACGNDFMLSALDDGTWTCGACRESGRWLPEGRTVADYS